MADDLGRDLEFGPVEARIEIRRSRITVANFRRLVAGRISLGVENADLEGVRVLVLPDVRVLSDRSSEVVRRFVKAGGGLVASGETGLFDHSLQSRTNFSLADVFHADYLSSREMTTREANVNLWLAAPEHPILNDDAIKGQEKTAWRNPSGPPPERGWLEMVGSATYVRAREEGQALVVMSTNENKAAASPGMIASTYGQGVAGPRGGARPSLAG